MLNKRYLAATLLAGGALAGQHAAIAADCGDISIASMAWASAELIAEIDKMILTKGYGCNAELMAGDTIPTLTDMIEKGSPDLAPELWIDMVREPLNAAVAQGELVFAAEVLADGGEEGWWIPKFVADANPEIKTPADALARPDLFPSPGNPDLGAVHNCPSGWSCHISTSNLFVAYDAKDKGFELIDTGSSAGLDGSIAKAHLRGEGWLGYYWSPTATLGRYEMIKLDMGPHDKEQWEACTAVQDCDTPQVNGWAESDVFSVVTNEFAKNAGVAMDYISVRTWKNEVVNKILAWMVDNQATGEEAAAYFLENYEDVWGAWVSSEVKAKVQAVL